eukprot:7931460-Pyramimonas_sp.AAC.1
MVIRLLAAAAGKGKKPGAQEATEEFLRQQAAIRALVEANPEAFQDQPGAGGALPVPMDTGGDPWVDQGLQGDHGFHEDSIGGITAPGGSQHQAEETAPGGGA